MARGRGFLGTLQFGVAAGPGGNAPVVGAARHGLGSLSCQVSFSHVVVLTLVLETTGLKISEEPLADRVLRQVRSGKLDEDRLLPSADKRARDVGKKLDRLAARQGWYTFMAGQAHAVATGKAPAKRNAEIMAVEQVARWRSEVSSFAPDRLRGGGPHSRVGPPPRSSVGGRRSRVRTGGGVDIAEVRQDHGPAGRHNPAAYECDPRVSARARRVVAP